MAYEVQVSTRVKKEIKRALSYIAEELGAPLAMVSLLNNIEKTFDALSVNPNAYPIDKEISNKAKITIRRINIKNYWILYTVDNETKTVSVISLLHSRQNKSRFFEDYRFKNS